VITLFIDYGPALLAWVAVLYRVTILRRPVESQGLRGYWFGLLALALAATVLLPPIYLAFDDLVGVRNLARLLAHSLVLVSSWCVQVYLYYLTYTDSRAGAGTRRSACVLVVALALMAACFAQVHVGEDAFNFSGHYASAPFVFEYRLVFLAYIAWALRTIIVLTWRCADVARSRPALHLGLRLVALGCVLGLVYVAHEGLWLATGRLGLPYPVPQPERFKQVLIAGIISLVALGASLPGWGPRVGIPALYVWAARYRACRRLYPLWRDLCQACPEIALVAPPSPVADALTVRGLGFRLSRRVVEIRDGHLALRPYMAPDVAAEARAQCQRAGLREQDEAAVVEAACLAAALQARRLGQRVGIQAPIAGTMGGTDIQGEAEFLRRVADHYRHSPVVRAVVARAAGEPGTQTGLGERLPA
jgi:hypothetical protein